MKIRPARPHEVYRIAEIHEQAACVAYAHIFPGQPFPRARTIERWQEFQGQVLVAEDGDTAIGFVAFDETELHALYVLPGFQGKGTGSRLLEAAGDVCALWVLEENHAARRFYEARGWTEVGKARSDYGVTDIRYHRVQPFRHPRKK